MDVPYLLLFLYLSLSLSLSQDHLGVNLRTLLKGMWFGLPTDHPKHRVRPLTVWPLKDVGCQIRQSFRRSNFRRVVPFKQMPLPKITAFYLGEMASEVIGCCLPC